MTLQNAISRCQNDYYNYPDVIDSSAGLYKVPELNVVGIPTWNRINKNNKRKIILNITTFKGIAFNAIHYYGKLEVDGVYTATSNDVNTSRNLSSEEIKKHPLLDYKYIFNILRPITNDEIELNPNRNYYYKEGDLIKNFNSIQSLIDDTINILKLRFTGNWKFIVQYPNGEKIEMNF